jgi:hypothetical protein
LVTAWPLFGLLGCGWGSRSALSGNLGSLVAKNVPLSDPRDAGCALVGNFSGPGAEKVTDSEQADRAVGLIALVGEF